MSLKRYAVIGDPIDHSLSPGMQSAALAAAHVDATYEAIRVPAAGLGYWIDRMHAQGYAGWNVTIPHKETIAPLLDGLADSAAGVGAVNTVVNRAGRLVGHNTDVAGFLAALSARGLDEPGHSAVVFGAGGAGRAVVHALLGIDARVTLVNRDFQRAVNVALMAGPSVRTLAAADPNLSSIIHEATLLVNATSLGMSRTADQSPLPDATWLSPKTAVFDLVYGRSTPFLVQAAAAGCVTMDGLEMLVRQGAAAFTLWTGIEPDLRVMRDACNRYLAGVATCSDS